MYYITELDKHKVFFWDRLCLVVLRSYWIFPDSTLVQKAPFFVNGTEKALFKMNYSDFKFS
jgi:hypothetical protein